MATLKEPRYRTRQYHQRKGRRMVQVWERDHAILLSHVIAKRLNGELNASMATLVHELVVQANLEVKACRKNKRSA